MKTILLLGSLFLVAYNIYAELKIDFNGSVKILGVDAQKRVRGPIKFFDDKSALISDKQRFWVPHCQQLQSETGSIEMRLKPVDWCGSDKFFNFFLTCRRGQDTIQLQKMPNGYLGFVIGRLPKNISVVASSVCHWKKGEWHTVKVSWTKTQMTMVLDGVTVKKVRRNYIPLELNPEFMVGGINYAPCHGQSAIDYLRVSPSADLKSASVAPVTSERSFRPMARNIATSEFQAVILPSSQLERHPERAVEMAQDGIFNTFFQSGTASRIWLEVRWPQPVKIDGVKLDFAPSMMPQNFELQYFDGKRWQPITTYTSHLEQYHKFSTVYTDRLRLNLVATSAQAIGIRELQVTGVAPRRFLPDPTWHGYFIWYPERNQNNVVRYFRRDFELPANFKVCDAQLQICADDAYVLYVNGQKLGSGGFAPTTYQVKDILQPGANSIAVKVDENTIAEGLLAELVITSTDNKTVIIPTNNSWKCSKIFENNWSAPNFKATNWTAAIPSPALIKYEKLIRYDNCIMAEPATFVLKKLRCPATLKPLEKFTVSAEFKISQKLKYDYGFRLIIGEKSLVDNANYTILTSDLKPVIKTSAWQTGQIHKINWSLALPNWAPHGSYKVKIQALAPQGEGRIDAPERVVQIQRFKTPASVSRVWPQAQVVARDNRLKLQINGREMASVIFALNGSYHSSFRQMGEQAGIKADVLRLALPTDTLYPAQGRNAEAFFRESFQKVDQTIKNALQLFPQGYLLLTVNLRLNLSEIAPEEALTLSNGKKVMHSFSSQKWLNLTRDGIRRLLKHLQKTPYAGHIAGIVLACGEGSESMIWQAHANRPGTPPHAIATGDFSPASMRQFRQFLRQKYHNNVTLLRQSWHDDAVNFANATVDIDELRRQEQQNFRNPAHGTQAMDYWEFHSDTVAQAIIAVAKEIKQVSQNRLVVGAWGFYSLAQYPIICNRHPAALHQIGSCSLPRLLKAPEVDLLVGIQSYAGVRAKTPLVTTMPTASFRLNRKLFVEEFDVRTFLTDLSFSHSHTTSQKETLEVMTRDFAEAYVRGDNCWFCGFSQGTSGRRALGWFAEDSLVNLINSMIKIDQCTRQFTNQSTAEVALFVHNKDIVTMDLTHSADTLVNTQYNTIYRELKKLAVSYDVYLLEDFAAAMRSPYKVVIMLNAFYLDQRQRHNIQQILSDQGKTVIWLYAPGYADPQHGLSVQQIQQLTGIKVTCRPEMRRDLTVEVNAPQFRSHKFGPYPYAYSQNNSFKIGPIFEIDDSQAQIVGRYRHNQIPAIAQKEMGKLTSIYCAVPMLSRTLMQDIFRQNGVHFYTTAPVYLKVSKHFLSVHAYALVDHVVTLKKSSCVLDLFRNQLVCENQTHFNLKLQPGESRLFFIGNPSEVEQIQADLKCNAQRKGE